MTHFPKQEGTVAGVLQLCGWTVGAIPLSRHVWLGALEKHLLQACVRNLEATQSKIKLAKKFGVDHYALHKGSAAHL